MRTRTTLLVAILSLLLSGCIGHHRYESHGTVTMASGGSTNALLYWYGDDGRLWYGKRYKEIDSDLEMNICGATSKQFTPDEEDTVGLQLPSRSGDLQVAEIGSGGKVVRLPEPKRLKPGAGCGKVLVQGTMVSTEDLNEGAKPEIIILCENKRSPLRYPQIGRYVFNTVTKTKVKGNDPPENVCAGP